MTKNQRIFKLFRSTFKTVDFFRYGPADGFYCPNENEDACDVNHEEEPIWSPFLGSSDSDVMVVAEAPSSTGGGGPHIGGLFADLEVGHKSPILDLRKFVQDNYSGMTPYFTDLVKCGVVRQRNKDILGTRRDKCIGRFLVEEIRIMRPKTLLCVGKTAYHHVMRYQKMGKIDRTIELVYLTHYSRQAHLPLTTTEKMDIVWKWQAKRMSAKEMQEKRLSVLSFFSVHTGETTRA